MSGHQLSARDYKRRHRTGLAIASAGLREFGFGLALGLAVALVVFIADHRAPTALLQAPRAPPRALAAVRAQSAPGSEVSATSADAAGGSADGASLSEGSYDFYRMLPKFEVVVPEHEHVTRLAPAARIDQPGVYFLQVGSYRDSAVAERVRAQLAKLGIASTVQRVAVDADVWHRVRVGPIRDLSLLNHLRQQLQADELDSLVIRVDD